jgi:hypothetical protein
MKKQAWPNLDVRFTPAEQKSLNQQENAVSRQIGH